MKKLKLIGSADAVLAIVFMGILIPGPVSGTMLQRGSVGYVPQLNAGERALAQHQYSSAASHFRYAIVFDSKGVGAHVGLGTVYLRIGKKQRALEEFIFVQNLDRHSAAAERGIHDARSDGEEQQAFQDLEDELKHDPANADLHTTYAEELLERGNIAGAEVQANAALKLDANQWHAYCALGRIALEQGHLEEAKAKLEIAVLHDDNDDDALSALGDLELKAGNTRTALKLFRKLAKVVPEDAEAHRKLASALDATGDKTGAAKERLIADQIDRKVSGAA